MSHPTIYNMPSGVPFLTTLASGLRSRFGADLQDGLILLPTRRAVRGMGEAFVTAALNDGGAQATLLPRMRPLADINPEEPPFEPGELAGQIDPAIDPVQRRFEMARLVARYHERASDLPMDAASALAMADPLLEILDDAAMEEVKLEETDQWKALVAQASEHFQHAATLYRIIEEWWPLHLSGLRMEESQARKVKLLHLLHDHWAENPPTHPVIIAGSTGTLAATRKLMKLVSTLPQGLIVLPGLQTSRGAETEINDETWAQIDLQHPQYNLKRLIQDLGVDRTDVADLTDIQVKDADIISARRRILTEALTPVGRTSDWVERIKKLRRDGGDTIFERATTGLSLIEARTPDEEALAVALVLREALETKGQTAALVTPDQELARRIRERLRRWDLTIDMSQGELLSQTPIGTFLDAVLDVSQSPSGPLERATVFRHGLTGLGEKPEVSRAAWQAVELKYYRGGPSYPMKAPEPDPIEIALTSALNPLTELCDKAGAEVWASALIAACETIATTDTRHGSFNLWQGEAGEAAAKMLEGIVMHGGQLPDIDATGFVRLMRRLMKDLVVRPRDGNHPRLSILGPLEARMLEADVIILSGLNEGMWPQGGTPGPFLSRGMRKAMKLSLPERRFGLAAHDFYELAANAKVVMTRSRRSESGPTVASRWVWRLQTLLQGAVGEHGAKALLASGDHYLDWARAMDYVPADKVKEASPPEPRPPVEKRWSTSKGRSLSITEVKTFIRDPYSIYGKHVLRLKPLNDLGEPQGPGEFGSAVHLGLETFLKDYDAPFGPEHDSEMVAHLKAGMHSYGYALAVIEKETARFYAIAQAMRAELNAREMDSFENVGQEVEGQAKLPGIDFSVRGVMDYVERGIEGYGFIDFKTGVPSSDSTVAAGFDPQLPLAGYIAAQGGLENLPKGDTAYLGYIQVKGSGGGFSVKPIGKKKDVQTLIDDSVSDLVKLIKAFDDPDKPYQSQVRVKYTHDWSNFDDLARRGEWAGTSDGDENV